MKIFGDGNLDKTNKYAPKEPTKRPVYIGPPFKYGVKWLNVK